MAGATGSTSSDSAPGSSIGLERRGPVAWLTLRRPAAMNSLDGGMVAALTAALKEIEADSASRVVVVTGEGRAFCAGGDLKAVKARAGDSDPEAAADRFIADVQALMLRLERFPRPTIACVNGLAVGGGLELLLCCDLVIARRGAKIGDGHANFGLLPGGGGSARLPRRIGAARAKLLMFTGDMLPAEELLAWGLVDRVAEPEALEEAVQAVAEKIGAKSPLGLARMKRLVDDSRDLSLDEALARERAVMADHRSSFDRAEGLAAFAAKRPPRFEGR